MSFTWWNDLRVAARTLRRRPWFTISAIVVLAVGIGANVAVFTVVKATLLDPPPYPSPDELVLLDLTISFKSRPGPQRAHLWSYPEFAVFQETPNRLADPVTAYAAFSFNLATSDGARLLDGEAVTGEYRDVIAIVPELGRWFGGADAEPDAPPVVMLGHDLWTEQYGSDSSIIGSSIALNGMPVTVLGIAPNGFRGLGGSAQLWVPVATAEQLLQRGIADDNRAHWFSVLGRTRPGASVETVAAQMNTVATAIQVAMPDPDPDATHGGDARLLSASRVTHHTRTSLLVLTIGASLLLAVACANLASFLLARALERNRETAIRLAIGGSRLRVAWSYLSECLLLSVVGGAFALWMAVFGVDLLVQVWPSRFLSSGWNLSLVDLDAMRVDGGVIAFAVGLSLVTGMVFGLLPAIRCTHINIRNELSRTGTPSGGRWGRVDLRGGIVVVGIAMALVLVTTASLLTRSLMRLQDVDRGVTAQHVLVFDYSLPQWSTWSQNPEAFQSTYLDRLRQVPGVLSASVTCTPPLERHCMFSRVIRAGSTEFADGSAPAVGVQYVHDDFFATFGVQLLKGRVFDRSVDQTVPPAVVLSATAAGELFPNGDAVGRRISLSRDVTSGGASAEVIGVVADVLYDRPEQGVTAEAYLSLRQGGFGSTVALRTSGDPLGVVADARSVLADLDRSIPMSNVRTLEALEAATTSDTRLLGRLLSVFSVLTLVLAATGVWAIVANRVRQRTRELGLRVALGAGSGSVVRLVLGQGLVLAALGILAGAVTVWGLSRLLQSLLFDISPLDPVSVLMGAGALGIVTGLAALVPARRAIRIDPMEVLRTE